MIQDFVSETDYGLSAYNGFSCIDAKDGPADLLFDHLKISIIICRGTQTVRIGREEIQVIQAVIEDNVLFETEYMEDPYGAAYFDGIE